MAAANTRRKSLAAEEKIPADSPLTLVVTKAMESDSLFQEQTGNEHRGNPEEGVIDDTFF